MSISIKTVRSDSFSMKYFTFGKGEKIFVILPGLSVQSVMGAADIIARSYEIFEKDFTVYVFDRAEKPPCPYSVYDMARDTAKAFETLGLKDVYLFGASQGGMIGLTMAVQYPALVKKLMLGSSAARLDETHYKTISEWVELAEKKDGVNLLVSMSKDIYPENVFEQFKETFENAGRSVTDGEMKRFIILTEGTKGFDVTKRLNDVTCPVLAIGSYDDKVLPGATEEIIRLMSDKKDFEYFMYSSYGHAAFDTAPDYRQRLMAFCK